MRISFIFASIVLGLSGTGMPGLHEGKSNVDEIEIRFGSLMLNMRDDRNRTDKGPTNGRAVAVTRDLGLTWGVSVIHVLQ